MSEPETSRQAAHRANSRLRQHQKRREEQPARPSMTTSDATSLDELSLPSLDDSLGVAAPGGGGDHLAGDPTRATPRLVRRGRRTAIYRLRDTGFKVVLADAGPVPSEEERLLALLHEQRISRYLPASCRRRRALDVTSLDRRPALSYAWVPGATLAEWLRRAPGPTRGGDDGSLDVRIAAATAVARTLADFHGAGVAFGASLALDDVVLAPHEGGYAATLIDLSGAIIFADVDDPAARRRILEGDLRALGRLLRRIFGGEDQGGAREEGPDEGAGRDDDRGAEEDGNPEERGRRKRGKPHSGLPDGLPPYLGMLIAALLDASAMDATPDAVRYASVKDVVLDLKALAEDGVRGRLRRDRLDASALKGRLLGSGGGAFYGRQVQMSMLLHLFQSAVALGNQPLMATISGYPGTGYVSRALSVGAVKIASRISNRVLLQTGSRPLSTRSRNHFKI